jgi:hypothetical protein
VERTGNLIEGFEGSRIREAAEAFTYAVMAPQFGDAFFDLTPAAKLTLFSQIMQLEAFNLLHHCPVSFKAACT